MPNLPRLKCFSPGGEPHPTGEEQVRRIKNQVSFWIIESKSLIPNVF